MTHLAVECRVEIIGDDRGLHGLGPHLDLKILVPYFILKIDSSVTRTATWTKCSKYEASRLACPNNNLCKRLTRICASTCARDTRAGVYFKQAGQENYALHLYIAVRAVTLGRAGFLVRTVVCLDNAYLHGIRYG